MTDDVAPSIFPPEVVDAVAADNGAQDVAPKSMSFPNPSGRNWLRDEPKDKAPRGKGLRSRETQTEDVAEATKKPETQSQRKRRIEKRVGKTYLAAAKAVDKIGMEYPSQVLVSQSTDFVDAVMEIAEEDARILEWLDSKAVLSSYWKLGIVGVSIIVPIAAYYGFAPEWAVDFLDVPPLPAEVEFTAEQKQSEAA